MLPRRLAKSLAVITLALGLCLCGCGPLLTPADGGGVGTVPEPSPGATSTSLPPTDAPTSAAPTTELTTTPPPAQLPTEMPSRDELRAVLGAYLASGGDVASLEEHLRAWGAFDEEMGGLWADADLNGDGQGDLLVTALDAAAEGFRGITPAGVLLAYLGDGQRYVETLFVSPDTAWSVPVVQAIADLTGDGQDEILYATTQCGAHTCFSNLQGYRWVGVNTEPLFDEVIEPPYPGFRVEDLDGDGTREVIVEVGTIGSVGAGPQRTYERVYAWDGEHYTLEEATVTSPQHPIHLINDADALVEQGAYEEAVELFERSYMDPDLDRTWEGPEGWQTALEAYARYRQVYAWASAGMRTEAEAAYTSLISQLGDDAAAMPFVGLAESFWAVYSSEGDVAAGCAAVREEAQGIDWPNVALNAFGYENRTYGAEDMCAVRPAAE